MTNILYFDVETIAPTTQMGRLAVREQLTPPKNYKSPEAIEKWMAEQDNKTGLLQWAAEPCSIAWAVMVGEDEVSAPQVLVRDQTVSASDFWRRAMDAIGHTPGVDRWCHLAGWNVRFDLRMWRAWCMRYRVESMLSLPTQRYDRRIHDVMDEFGLGDMISLEKACFSCGIDALEGSGADVQQWWDEYELKQIGAHNLRDVVATIELANLLAEYS